MRNRNEIKLFKRYSIWYPLLASLLVFITVPLLIWSFINFYNRIIINVEDLNFAFRFHIISISLFILNLLLWLHLWSVALSDRAVDYAKAKEYEEEINNPELKNKEGKNPQDELNKLKERLPSYDSQEHDWSSNIPCKYCGLENVRIVCHGCDSIQWNENRSVLCWAIFFAHHRWKWFVGLLAILWVTPITVCSEQYFITSDRIESKNLSIEKDSQQAIEKLLNLRSSVLEFEYAAQTDSVAIKTEWMSKFNMEFYQSSWFISKVFDYLRNTSCTNTSSLENKKNPNKRLSCEVINAQKKQMLKLDTLYLNLVKHYNQTLFRKDLNSHFISERKKLSREFYEHAKLISCAIGELSYNEELKDKFREKIYDCTCSLISIDKSLANDSISNNCSEEEKYFYQFLPWEKKNRNKH